MSTNVRLLTYADYLRLPADGFRHEIIDGEEFMTPAPTPEHQLVVTNVVTLLSTHVGRKKLGRVLVAPTDVVLSEHDVVEPDVLFVANDRLSIIGPDSIAGAPDLVVEVLSPSTATVDRGRKLALYARSGVKECWIADPAARIVEIHEFGSPRRTRAYRGDQEFRSDLFPRLVVRVGALFA